MLFLATVGTINSGPCLFFINCAISPVVKWSEVVVTLVTHLHLQLSIFMKNTNNKYVSRTSNTTLSSPKPSKVCVLGTRQLIWIHRYYFLNTCISCIENTDFATGSNLVSGNLVYLFSLESEINIKSLTKCLKFDLVTINIWH